MKLVLLFNTCAHPSRAAHLHTAECPMTNISGRRVIRIEDAELASTISDLNERGWPVRECKCVARARAAQNQA